ncbi:TetR/AcrR family transcriptional regulator [Glutamicibacter sp.]|uniref:TetR/AcrR family transcriptional regulator n=1 Tax=Glutamicibacter sp. TaxID=1931995 RepID=UPI002B4840F0|nr:TetR/AcrR family transcriptional regulator [Glutamicibacter sp.]HJX78642.1 TetR/AcrR family transcriptional regulator [Glutamicibacter sp.]
MSNFLPNTDRRTETKARHRRSIIDAAASIMRNRLTSDFSVDELAQAADLSKRTLFNHFASLDEVVIEVFGNELGEVVERLASHTPPGESRESIFDELATTLRSTDLVSPMVYLTQVLGSEEPVLSPRQAHMAARAFTAISERLTGQMLQRHSGSDPLLVQLLVSSLTNGLLVIYTHWVSTLGAVDTPESRNLWAQLLERLIDSLRTGFGDS